MRIVNRHVENSAFLPKKKCSTCTCSSLVVFISAITSKCSKISHFVLVRVAAGGRGLGGGRRAGSVSVVNGGVVQVVTIAKYCRL